jgi:hypothetical protein
MVGKDSYVNRSDKAVYRVLDNEAMIVNPGGNKMSVLNNVGSRIWEMADGRIGVGKIAGAVHEEFNITYEQALTDAIDFLEELSEKGLIEVK